MLHASEGNTKNFVVRRNATLEVVQTNCIWPATSHDQIICFLKKKKKKRDKNLTSSIILIHQNSYYLLTNCQALSLSKNPPLSSNKINKIT